MTIKPQLIYVRINQSIITNENIQISSHFQSNISALHARFVYKHNVEYLTHSWYGKNDDNLNFNYFKQLLLNYGTNRNCYLTSK